jgi:CheY-like chemotaxis protein
MSASDWILVVDDDDDIREVILLMLSMRGYRAEGAVDGLDALEKVRARGRPCGVLLDLRMPRMSGQDFARTLRADPALAATPIVVLSGDVRALDEGFAVEAHLKKPIEMTQLYQTVATCFHATANPTRRAHDD